MTQLTLHNSVAMDVEVHKYLGKDQRMTCAHNQRSEETLQPLRCQPAELPLMHAG